MTAAQGVDARRYLRRIKDATATSIGQSPLHKTLQSGEMGETPRCQSFRGKRMPFNGDAPMQPEWNAQVPPTLPHRHFTIAGLVLLAGLTGAVAAKAFDPPPFGPDALMQGGSPTTMDPAMLAESADRGVRHMAIEIDATADQEEKLRATVRDLVKDLVPLRSARVEAAERARALLIQPTIDKAEIEKFRAEQIAKVDAVSKRLAKAIGDAAEILTPEQRRKLVDRLPQPGVGPFRHRG
jgi:periplasmic protein CpxP/Spy